MKYYFLFLLCLLAVSNFLLAENKTVVRCSDAGQEVTYLKQDNSAGTFTTVGFMSTKVIEGEFLINTSVELKSEVFEGDDAVKRGLKLGDSALIKTYAVEVKLMEDSISAQRFMLCEEVKFVINSKN
jgi:hypothetical protein